MARAFSDLERNDQQYSLHIAGKPSSDDLVQVLAQHAVADSRIALRMGFIEDADLVREVGEAELVVLPYHEMHNSGSVLAALSLERPVLVLDNEFNRALATEFGEGWVVTFPGELTAESIRQALRRTRSTARSSRPDLSSREWPDAGPRHRATFRSALATVANKRLGRSPSRPSRAASGG